MPLKGLCHDIFEVSWPSTNLPLNWRKPENNASQRWKNTKDIEDITRWRRLQNSRFRKVGSAVSVILECESREPHTPAGCVRRENDCWLFIQRIRSKEGLYNVTEVTEITWQLHPHLKFDTLDAFFSREICCVLVQWWFGKDERFCFSVKYRTCPFLKRLKSVKWTKQHRKNRPRVEEKSQKKRQRRTIADWGIPSRSVPSPWRKELHFVNSLLAVWHDTWRLKNTWQIMEVPN